MPKKDESLLIGMLGRHERLENCLKNRSYSVYLINISYFHGPFIIFFSSYKQITLSINSSNNPAIWLIFLDLETLRNLQNIIRVCKWDRGYFFLRLRCQVQIHFSLISLIFGLYIHNHHSLRIVSFISEHRNTSFPKWVDFLDASLLTIMK